MSSQPNFPETPGLGNAPQGVPSWRKRRSVDGPVLVANLVAQRQPPVANPIPCPQAGAVSGGYRAVAQPARVTGHFEPVPFGADATVGQEGGVRSALSPQEHESRAREVWKRSMGGAAGRNNEASDVARLAYTLQNDPEKYDRLVANVRKAVAGAFGDRREGRPTPDEVARVIRQRCRQTITEILNVKPGTDDEQCAQAAQRAHSEIFGDDDDEPARPPTSDGRTSLYYNTSSRHKRIA